MSREVMQQALEALENDAMQRTFAGGVRISNAAIALREALAAPEPEPVAWIQPDHLQKARVAPFLCRVEPTQRCPDFVPLYTAPLAAPSVPAWIACSEQMPDDDIQVLVWATGQLFSDGNCWVAARAGDWFVDDDGRTVSGVTHWMDLPGEPEC